MQRTLPQRPSILISQCRFVAPNAVEVTSDGTLYVGDGTIYVGGNPDEGLGCIRQIHGGKVSTLCQLTAGYVNGLLLDEGQGVLYVTAGSRIFTVFIGTLAERREARYYPVLRTWALVQDEAAEMIPATATESADESQTRARKALDCAARDGVQADCSAAARRSNSTVQATGTELHRL